MPVPYLLRYAAFLYETQLRGVQMQLRLGEAMSASISSSTFGGRNRAPSRRFFFFFINKFDLTIICANNSSFFVNI